MTSSLALMALIGTPAPNRDDLVWADLIQFVLRLARDAATEAIQSNRACGYSGRACAYCAATAEK